jgi:hypothetical protein
MRRRYTTRSTRFSFNTMVLSDYKTKHNSVDVHYRPAQSLEAAFFRVGFKCTLRQLACCINGTNSLYPYPRMVTVNTVPCIREKNGWQASASTRENEFPLCRFLQSISRLKLAKMAMEYHGYLTNLAPVVIASEFEPQNYIH